VINWLTGQINDRNGMLDDAIANYEAVLATQVPERRFDFHEDYEVINALGTTLYNRARREPRQSSERIGFLRRSRSAYARTLTIDSENVAAHYGLGLVYSELGRRDPAAGAPEDSSESPPVDLDHWSSAIDQVANRRLDPQAQRRQLRGLLAGVEKLVSGERPEFGSRLEPLYEVVEKLGPLTEEESEVGADLARLLERTHRSLHALLKPDETAEGRAVAIARRRDPAADQNAQSIVIHSLHRVGAPGVEPVAARSRNEATLSKEG
jgi:hypothetical protein